MSKNILLILSTLFIVTMSWHVSYPSNILVFGFMGLLIVFYSQNPFPLTSKTIYLIIFVMFIYLFLSVINLTLYDNINIHKIEIFIQKLALSIFLFAFVIIFYKDREDILFKSIEYALWIIVGLWIMQFVVYYTTGEYIDLLEPFAHRPQRYQAYFITETTFPIDIIRPTSIYIEPGTYAVNTLPLLILSYLYRNKLTLLHGLVLLTDFMSLSLFGIIVAVLFILVTVIHQFEFKINKQNILVIVLFLLIGIGVQEYLHFRFITEENTGALGIRENAIGYWLSQGSHDLIFGLGNANKVFLQDAIVDDSGFIFKLFFEYGIFALLILFFMTYISWGVEILFLAIILLTKLHYLIYIIWFYLAALYLFKERQKRLYL